MFDRFAFGGKLGRRLSPPRPSRAKSGGLRRYLYALPTGLAVLAFAQTSPAAAAPRACPLVSVSGPQVGGVQGDPSITYSLLAGRYTQEPRIAYRLTGQFPHATAYTLLAMDDFTFVPGSPGYPAPPAPSSAYMLKDFQIQPDRGSVNPFHAGNPINAPNRNYTIWVWPDTVPVPAGLRNVLLFPTMPVAPYDFQHRWSVVFRQYLMQPGYSAQMSLPKVEAVSTSHPNVAISCPASMTPSTERSVLTWSGLANTLHVYVPAVFRTPPAGTALSLSRSVHFERAPFQYVGAPDGPPVHGANDALSATLDLTKITVVTIHRMPTFFNNQHLSGKARMRKYQVRYMSVVVGGGAYTGAVALPDTSAILRRDRSWVTVLLPSVPRLTPEQERKVRAKAAALHYNVLQDPTPRQSFATLSAVAIRQRLVSGDFCCAVTRVPSWTDVNNPATARNDYRDWPLQTSPAFFARYASSPHNMGPYWVGGTRESYSEFMAG